MGGRGCGARSAGKRPGGVFMTAETGHGAPYMQQWIADNIERAKK